MDSKNNGPVLWFNIILSWYYIKISKLLPYLLSFVTDAKDEQGVKLEKVGQTFSRFRAMPAKITEQTYIAGFPRWHLPLEVYLLHISGTKYWLQHWINLRQRYTLDGIISGSNCGRSFRGLYRPLGRDPFNHNFRKFRSKTQWLGSVQPEKFRKNGSTFWGGQLFPVGPVGILVEWIAPLEYPLQVVTLRNFYMHMLAYTCHKPGCDSKRCHQGVPNTFHEPIRIASGDDKEYER